jgi:phosphoribosyl 1,2-cyclic phosphate phosphodiesterase
VDLAYSNVKYCDTVNEYIKFTTIQPFSSVKIGGYLVTAVPARHITYFPEEKALLYLIEHNNRRVFYGLDSGWYLDETWDYLSGVHLDCLIMDCTNGIFQHEVGNHMGLPDNLKVVKRLLEMGTINRDTRVISTHFSHNGKVVYSKHADEFARSGILMAYDGMELEI